MANIKRTVLPFLAFLAIALPASAQVSLPRTGVLNNAQPVFCVNPTTAVVEDCVSGGGGGGGAITAASGSYSSGALSAGAIVDLGTGASPAANTVNANLNTGNTSAATTATNTGTTATNTGTIATNTGTTATNTGTIAGAVSSSVMQSNTKQVNGVTTLAGAGASGTGSQRVTVAQDSTTVAGSSAIPAGSAIIGKVGIDQTTPGTTNGVQVLTGSTTAVTQATAANLNATVVGTGTFVVQNAAAATGGATPVSILSANSTNATVVKASAGTLYHISVQNSSTSALAYLIFFNTTTTPTCTGTPYYGPILVPYVGSTGNNGSGVIEDFAVGLSFTTGISYCITTAAAGTGSVAASAVSGGLGYK